MLTEDQRKSFAEAAEPLMKWLCENMHPHAKVIVDPDSAELVTGEMSHINQAFIKD